ncbi:hypothetical protein MMC07_003151 [Pseudocyphellaria aurata]|nr:hypothetical protein [Pseudocyphellaria aurata]
MSAQKSLGPSSVGSSTEIPPWVRTLQPMIDKITEIRGSNSAKLIRIRELGIVISRCEEFCESLKAIQNSPGEEPASIVFSQGYLDHDLYRALKQIEESKYQGQDLIRVIDYISHLTDHAVEVADDLLGPDEDKWEQTLWKARRLMNLKDKH